MTKNRTTTLPKQNHLCEIRKLYEKYLANGLEPRYNGDVQIPCHRIF